MKVDRLIQRNAEVYNMPEEEGLQILHNLFVGLIKKVDYVNPEAFTTLNDVSIGFMEDLIKKGKMFNHKADSFLPGEPNKCFDNCMAMGNSRLKIYMGFALSDNEQAAIARGCNDIPEELKFFGWVIHCWLVDKKTGKVIETNNASGCIAYFGFQVNVDYIKNWVRSLQRYPITPELEKRSMGAMNLTLKNSDVLADAISI